MPFTSSACFILTPFRGKALAGIEKSYSAPEPMPASSRSWTEDHQAQTIAHSAPTLSSSADHPPPHKFSLSAPNEKELLRTSICSFNMLQVVLVLAQGMAARTAPDRRLSRPEMSTAVTE